MLQRRWPLILGGAILVIAMVAGIGIYLAVQRNKPAATDIHAPPRPLPSGGPNLSFTARQLIALLDSARNRTFHARYLLVGPAGSQSGVTLELWRHPPRIREDTTLSEPGRTAHVAAFQLPSGNISCSQTGDVWQCVNVPGKPSGTSALIAAVTEQLSGRSVIEHDDVVGGRQVHCYEIAGGSSAPSKLCATPEGIPVSISTAQSRLDLAELSSDVPDSVFTPPATPSPVTASPSARP